ncbi:PREDICTED: cysteine-rich and transmembrane domain-containing protein A-like [Tarenaya hassleriana]|uniref:cysteine-rich and transmembrane domain-containing protein A-like n=1 Tax=Tarenaya hassleriana TaxID=28532 RepID=UPI00053C8A5C|nr:PREDICTED: cysteine-rich and transmembrane domain-containing protein A-like [Tarenaya hassleriana]
MSQYNQYQTAGAYPPPPVSTGPYVAPPPVGYPTRDTSHQPVAPSKVETKSKGDGFWKGCCAALCCCCVLDACF